MSVFGDHSRHSCNYNCKCNCSFKYNNSSNNTTATAAAACCYCYCYCYCHCRLLPLLLLIATAPAYCSCYCWCYCQHCPHQHNVGKRFQQHRIDASPHFAWTVAAMRCLGVLSGFLYQREVKQDSVNNIVLL